MALWFHLLTHSHTSASKTLKKSQSPWRKPWKTKLWKPMQRRLKKRAAVVILLPVIHMYWAKREWWLSGDYSSSVPLQMNEFANAGRGKLKPLMALSTPQRPRHRMLNLSTSWLPLPKHPLGTHYIQFICIFMQTNTWLHVQSRASDKRQMRPPQRIHPISCCSTNY